MTSSLPKPSQIVINNEGALDGRPRLPAPDASFCLWRFDVLSVYYDSGHRRLSFELFQNAFSVSYNRKFSESRFADRY